MNKFVKYIRAAVINFAGKAIVLCGISVSIIGCGSVPVVEELVGPKLQRESWDKPSEVYMDLRNLPKPRGKIVASIYNFRDLTGQYKPAPSSGFSTAVSQGSAALLLKAARDSGWFAAVEREGLQDLLTERKIIRAALKSKSANADVPPLLGANVLLEGGIVGYESNMKTGGAGAKYFGLGVSEQYRVDQVSVNLRVVDVNSGRVINSVTTTRSILSRSIQGGLFRFVRFKRLLEIEAGYTRNEPVQLCLVEAIQAAIIGIIVEGIEDKSWTLMNIADVNHPLIKKYGRGLATQQAAVAKQATREKGSLKTDSDMEKTVSGERTRNNKTAKDSSIRNEHVKSDARHLKSKNAADSANKSYVSKASNAKPPMVKKLPSVAKPVIKKAVATVSSNQLKPRLARAPALLKAENDVQAEPLAGTGSDIPAPLASIKIDNEGDFVIQLISSPSSMKVLEFAEKFKIKRDMMEYIHFKIKGKVHFAILYGRFKTKMRAIKAIESLPPALRIHEPRVRLKS